MPGETTRTPLTRWSVEVARATVLAYRRAMGEGLDDWQSYPLTRAAYLAAGADPDAAPRAIPEIIAAAARDHGEWFWRPVRLRLDREERWLKACGIWPPPFNRSSWPPMPEDVR
jgi:hypothetical protein